MSVRTRIALGAVALVATASLITQPLGDARAQTSAWHISQFGRVGESYSFAWAPDGAAWTNPSEDSDRRSAIVAFRESKESTAVLATTPSGQWDGSLTWYRGRYYWVRASNQGWLGDSFAILSAEPGQKAPTTVISRGATFHGLFQLVAGRMLWSEWLPSMHEWAVYSMRLGGKPHLVSRFPGDPQEDDFNTADVCLGSRVLAWAELVSGEDERGKTTVHVLPIDAHGQLAREIVLDAGGSYSPFTLAADVDRVAWAAEDGSRIRVLTWRLRDRRPTEVPGSAQTSDPQATPFISLAMSSACIAWTSETDGADEPLETTVKVWLPGRAKATTLSTYKYRPSGTTVGTPVVSRSRVAWVVAGPESDINDTSEDAPLLEPDGSVVTWQVGDQTPQSIASHVPITDYDSELAVDGDRVSYGLATHDLEHVLCIASAESSLAVAAVDETGAIGATVTTVTATNDAVRGGIPAGYLVLAGLAGAGALGALAVVVVRRRRKV